MTVKLSGAKQIILDLRKKIPSFECEKGCSMCCGPVTFSKWEWEQVKIKKKATSLNCPYILPNQECEIYEDRPILCRLFGTIPEMICPCGCRPERMLDSEESRMIMVKYFEVLYQ